MDLVKEILSEVRETDPFSLEPEDFHAGRLPGHWDIRKVSYHLVLLLEGGFLARSTLHTGISGVANDSDSGIRLTWRGHDLLDRLNDRETFSGDIVEPRRRR
jgi:hypothetical protein